MGLWLQGGSNVSCNEVVGNEVVTKKKQGAGLGSQIAEPKDKSGWGQ